MQQAAVRHTTKCAAMGGKFIMWCDLTERFKFLYIIVVRREIFRRFWARTRTWIMEGTDVRARIQNAGTLCARNSAGGASSSEARGNVVMSAEPSSRLSRLSAILITKYLSNSGDEKLLKYS